MLHTHLQEPHQWGTDEQMFYRFECSFKQVHIRPISEMCALILIIGGCQQTRAFKIVKKRTFHNGYLNV